VAGKPNQVQVSENFLQGSASGEFVAGTARLQITATKRALPNPEEAELLAKRTGESSSTAPYGSTLKIAYEAWNVD
jgi:hypothetical protein